MALPNLRNIVSTAYYPFLLVTDTALVVVCIVPFSTRRTRVFSYGILQVPRVDPRHNEYELDRDKEQTKPPALKRRQSEFLISLLRLLFRRVEAGRIEDQRGKACDEPYSTEWISDY